MATYHITLNGNGYLVDLARYTRRPAPTFAPKGSEGARDVGDFLVEEGLRVSDWSGGEGYLQLDPDRPERWRAGQGIDGFTEPGSLRLGPNVESHAGPSNSENTCGTVYKGKLYFGWNDGSLVSWDGSAFATVATTGKAGGIRSLAVAFGKLYVGNGTDGQVDEYDGATYTANKFTIAGALGVRAMGVHYRQAAQFLYLGADRATNGRVYYWDGATLSSAQFEFEQPRPEAMAVFNRRLYFAVADSQSRRGALYSVDDAGSGGNYAHHEVFSQHYPCALAAYQGRLWIGTGGSPDGLIYSYDGGQLRVEKRLGTIYAPYTLDIRGLWVYAGALWVGIIQDGAVGLLRYDGVGWSRPSFGHAGTNAIWLGAYAGDLYFGVSAAAGQARLFRTRPNYRASGMLETGLFDAGLPSIDKVWRSLTLTHAPLPAGMSIEVQYRLEDSGGWTVLGTSSTTNATSATFAFSGTVAGKQVAFRVVLAGSAGSSSSPVLYDLLLRYALAPPLKRAWEIPIALEGTLELPQVTLDGQPNPRTGPQMSADLWTAKALPGPITFVDLDGASRPVYFTDLEEKIAPITQRKGHQTIATVRLVEA